MELQMNVCDFPDEILLSIMSHLSSLDLRNLLLSSKFFYRFVNENNLWKIIVTRDLPHLVKYLPPQKNYKWLAHYNNINNKIIKDGIGIQILDNKVLTGEFKNGKLDGYGIAFFNNGIKYEGEWVNGEREGMGFQEWPDGDKYDGKWHLNKRHGYGIYKWSNSSWYMGDFDMDEMEGRGIYGWAEGTYTGEWHRSIRSGYGKIIWKNGNRFEGVFNQNTLNNLNLENNQTGIYNGTHNGTHYWADGSHYTGNWINHKRFGYGIHTMTNGVIYMGEYEDDLRNGKGELIWPNGYKFVGTWKNGGRKGPGILYLSCEDLSSKINQIWNEPACINYSENAPSYFC